MASALHLQKEVATKAAVAMAHQTGIEKLSWPQIPFRECRSSMIGLGKS
jgi:hypothetical protein